MMNMQIRDEEMPSSLSCHGQLWGKLPNPTRLQQYLLINTPSHVGPFSPPISLLSMLPPPWDHSRCTTCLNFLPEVSFQDNQIRHMPSDLVGTISYPVAPESVV